VSHHDVAALADICLPANLALAEKLVQEVVALMLAVVARILAATSTSFPFRPSGVLAVARTP
jgi:hypothetical protein